MYRLKRTLLMPPRLSKMRRLATGLLVLMAVLYVLSRSFEDDAAIFPWLRAFTEAAVVGALADWFAVTALFRHPMGIPIPHTAIVRREKERIGRSVARFVRKSFFNAREVRRQWGEWRSAERVLIYLSEPANVGRRLNWLLSLAPRLLTKADSRSLSHLGAKSLMRGLRGFPMGRMVSIFLEGFLKSPTRRELIAPILGRLGKGVSDNRDWVMSEAARGTQPSRIKIFDTLSRTAAALVSGKAVKQLAKELEAANEDHDHRIYEKIEEALAETRKELSDTDNQAWEALKERILGDPETHKTIKEVIGKASLFLVEGAEALEESATVDEWAQFLSLSAEKLRQDPDRIAEIEKQSCEIVANLMERYSADLERIVASTVASWEADELIEKIEHQVGPDLQFIRINGTLIGGCVGLILHGVGLLIW